MSSVGLALILHQPSLYLILAPLEALAQEPERRLMPHEPHAMGETLLARSSIYARVATDLLPPPLSARCWWKTTKLLLHLPLSWTSSLHRRASELTERRCSDDVFTGSTPGLYHALA